MFSLPPSPVVETPPDSPGTSTNFVGGENTIWSPPDTMGAVGPNHVMVMINGRVKIENRGGGLVSTTNLNSWWNEVGPFNANDPTNFVGV